MDLFIDVLLDSVLDTLELIPFLFVTYLAMEALEHGMGGRLQAAVARSGRLGPVVGAVAGALPQCGFSAMAATLLAGGVVSAGTFVAVVLSTSDEMIPVFVAHQAPVGQMLALMAFKVIVGLVAGLWVDAMVRVWHIPVRERHIHELCERAHCGCDDCEGCDAPEGEACCAHEQGEASTCSCAHDHARDHMHDHAHEHDHGHGHEHGSPWLHIVRSALVHTVQVTFFIFLVTLVFGLAIEYVGQDAIGAALADHPVRAAFLAALVGLIPNCGASVAITELYLDGILAAGPMVAGLLSSGGVGLLVLWRTNDDARQNLALTACIYVLSVAVGLAVGASGMSF